VHFALLTVSFPRTDDLLPQTFSTFSSDNFAQQILELSALAVSL